MRKKKRRKRRKEKLWVSWRERRNKVINHPRVEKSIVILYEFMSEF